MAKNLGLDVSSVYEAEGYNFDKVVFQKGKPILDAEVNLSQELQEILRQKSTAHLPSGWLSYRPYYTSSSLSESFYTQNPTGSKPEVALVNGWPIHITNTKTALKHVNKIDLSQSGLNSGSRVDGVFLEVWRSLISPGENDGINKPDSITKVGDIRDIYMYNDSVGWACGENGIILNTTDGGNIWNSQEKPVDTNFNAIKFQTSDLGYIVGNSGNIIKTNNGGDSWNIVFNDVSSNLNDVYIIEDGRVCVVGDDGTVLLSTDGTLFNSITSVDGVTDNLKSVYFYDSFVGWACGENGSLIRTLDGGLSWTKIIVKDSLTSLNVNVNLNSLGFFTVNDGIVVGDNGTILKSTDSGSTWTCVSDRIFYGGSYKSLNEIYVNNTNTLTKVNIRKEFPIEFSIGAYPGNKRYFNNFKYQISPSNYPNSLILEYDGILDGQSYRNVLNLSLYENSDELKNAIDSITSPYKAEDVTLPEASRQKIRVFTSTVNYVPVTLSDLRSGSGSFTSDSAAVIDFSLEDKAWITGTNGILLKTNNSGSKWETVSTDYGNSFNSAFYVTGTLGWYVSNNGVILNYNAGIFSEQSTDLVYKSSGRVYPEGNIESEAEEYLIDNIINPLVGVETTKRVQIQYRIRSVEGVDPFNFPEAGLGADYIYSLGPNTTESSAGNYFFQNMGTENGDYGLWRSRCKNTVDGYAYAVPMFFVTRRNLSPFDPNSNINGSTYENLGAIRPDLQTYQEIRERDIVDIRRKININSYSHLLEKDFNNLLDNSLYTSISNRSQEGSQYGTSVFTVDTYAGATQIGPLLNGQVTSEASLVERVRDVPADPTPTPTELTFGPIQKGLFHNDPSFYSAQAVRIVESTETVTEDVEGVFEGLGTSSVTFTIDQNYTPTGGTDNVVYRLKATYLDYSGVGLKRVPKIPLGITYVPGDVTNKLYYRGINKNISSEIIEELTERVSGYKDYTVINSAIDTRNSDELSLYQDAGTASETDPDYNRSINKFREQQFRGSLIEYHYFTRVESSTKILKVPKNINEYSVFAVKDIRNVNGSQYRVATTFQDFETIRDREETVESTTDDSNLIVYLDDAYIIPAGSIVEVTLEVMTFPSDNVQANLGITVSNKGENIGAYRAGYVSNYGVTSKGITGFYKSIMYPVSGLALQDNDVTNVVTVDLLNPASGLEELANGIVLGVSSFPTREKNRQMYLWYQAESSMDYYAAVPISSVENLGTSTVTVNIDSRVNLRNGTAYIPIIVKQFSLPSLQDATNTTANVFYKYVPYQSVKDLPESMTVEIIKGSDFVYVSNLGTGSSSVIIPEPYESPIEHIAVNDNSFLNDNIFSNIDDIDLINFTVETGFIKLPATISNNYSGDIIFSSPNNVGDSLGRTFYEEASKDLIYEALPLSISTPRKVFVPVLGRVRSDITKPFLRGELVLIIISKVYKARNENKVGTFTDNGEEYRTGFFEEADTAINIYRLTNKPLVRM